MYVIPALASNDMPQQHSSNMVGYRWGVVETAELVGSSSVLDSQAWQDIMPHRQPGGLTRPPSILETGGTCKAIAIALHLTALHMTAAVCTSLLGVIAWEQCSATACSGLWLSTTLAMSVLHLGPRTSFAHTC